MVTAELGVTWWSHEMKHFSSFSLFKIKNVFFLICKLFKMFFFKEVTKITDKKKYFCHHHTQNVTTCQSCSIKYGFTLGKQKEKSPFHIKSRTVLEKIVKLAVATDEIIMQKEDVIEINVISIVKVSLFYLIEIVCI